LRTATQNAAAVLGLQDEIGQLRPGWRADLLLLDGDPAADIRNVARIRWLIKDGRVIDRSALLQTPD
jgi:imidazolonepropionase-like amidohydrolase